MPNVKFLVFISIASALGGLLWGFDAIVISGARQPVIDQFALSANWEGFFVSSGLLGAVIGSALSGIFADRFGRAKSLLLAAIFLFVSALGSAYANSIELLTFMRWFGGLGVGLSAMVCPLYLSEISPAHLRGRLVTVFQFAITLGIMIALFSNYGITQWASSIADKVAPESFAKWFIVDETWRAMFATELIPGVIFLVMAFFLPESPRFLVKKGQHEKAAIVLGRIFKSGVDKQLSAIQENLSQEAAAKVPFATIFKKPYIKPLLIGIALAAFAQFSGINVVFYYGTSMLESAGFKADSALSGLAIIGFFNMIFTTVAMLFVDKFGRRKLLFIGTVGCIACLVGISSSFNENGSSLLIIMMCAFVAFFAFSLGPIKFIFASEIFPSNIRSYAMSMVILTMWATDTIVAQFTPALRDGIGVNYTFLLFAVILIPQLYLIWKHMPETAGKTLEEIELNYKK